MMTFLEAAVLGAGLSMDSFALSITNGMSAVKRRISAAFLCAMCYGFFQGSLTCIGYKAGAVFAEKIRSIDHYVAFSLLCFVGTKMILESKNDQKSHDTKLSAAFVFVSAFATSLDALTVGVTLGTLSVNIVFVGAVIALVSMILCLTGFLFGSKAGKHLGSAAQIIGGLVLIALGVRVLLTHIWFNN